MTDPGPSRKLLFATANQHKLAELRAMVPIGIEIVGLDAYPELPDIIEDGETFRANALIKAAALHSYTGIECLAEDSGLVVPALDGLPGIHSARYAGIHGDSRANITKLLHQMADITDRSAHFHSCICLLGEDGPSYFEGDCHGTILYKPEGKDGFGYDPVFQPLGCVQSFACMSSAEKNLISHRSKALDALLVDLLS